MKRSKIKETINKIFFEYVYVKEDYYRQKLLTHQPIKDIVRESLMRKEFIILKRLICKEFPNHVDFIYKCILIQ